MAFPVWQPNMWRPDPFHNRTMLKKSSPRTGNDSPNLDDVRRQSRHRLIGASLLVVVAVIGFPMVFDTQPRRIPVDLPIHIPAQPTVSPLASSNRISTPPETPTAAPVAPAPSAAAPEVKPVNPAAPAAKEKVASAKTEPTPPNRPDAAGLRFVVQVGAYADAASVRRVRQKIERAGMKTYTQVAKTPEGNRTRVRLGPFSSRAEAEKAAKKVTALGLKPSVLTL